MANRTNFQIDLKKTFSETMLGTKLLAQLEAKEVMLDSSNNTLHAYGTEKDGHEFGTNSGQYSLGLAEMVMGDIINDSYDSFLDMMNNTNVF